MLNVKVHVWWGAEGTKATRGLQASLNHITSRPVGRY